MAETSNSWDYRVVRRAWGDGSTGDTFLAIHEAHYSEDKETPQNSTKEPTVVTGDTAEELADVLDKMRGALAKPVLEYADFEPAPDETNNRINFSRRKNTG
jgi:ATP-dependent DNA ligase